MTVNEDLYNRGVRHAMLLEGLKDSEIARISKFLGGRLRRDLIEAIQSDYRPDLGFRSRRLQRLLRELDRIAVAGMEKIKDEVMDSLIETGGMSVTFASEALSEALPFSYAAALPGPNMVRAVVMNEPVNGKLVPTWFKELGGSLSSKATQQINLGLVAGDTVEDIIRRIRGTRANRFNDGLIAAARRDVDAVVRTQMTHVSNRARELLYERNADVIKGVRYVAVLDARTTDICAGLDGQVFKPTFGPRPPLHMRCRSTTVPVTKSWSELAEEFKSERFKNIPESRVNRYRASMDGLVSGRETYSSWLKKQPRQFQESVLGKKKAELFRDGRVSLSRFVNYGTFPPKSLTVEQLLDLERSLGRDAKKINEQIKKSLAKTGKPRQPIR